MQHCVYPLPPIRREGVYYFYLAVNLKVMNLAKQKIYITLPLVLTVLLVARTTGAQIMPATENLSSTSAPLVTDELIMVESSSNPNIISPVTPNERVNTTREQRIALTKVRQTRILNLSANISNRMDTAVMRLSNISLRLEQRIIKVEEGGLEAGLAREKLLSANELLAFARLKLRDIDTLVNEATFSTKPRNDWQAVRERYREASSLIRQAHFALRESIMFLKNPVLNNKETGIRADETNPIAEELISN